MATPAAVASISTALPPPVAAATPPNKKEFPTVVETLQQQLAAKGKLASQYNRLLSGIVRAYDNPIEVSKREELVKRLIDEARKTLDNPQKAVKAEPVKKPGIEYKIDELTKRVNLLFGEISSALTAFINTKQIDDLENIKLKETSKGGEFKKVDRNSEKVDEFIRKNNDLMNEFVKLYKTLNNKIKVKSKLIAGHVVIEKTDEAALAKVKKKFGFSDSKVKDHFEKQETILKERKSALQHLTVLNEGITKAFEKVQRETHYFLDCWVNKDVISRTNWRTVGNAFGVGYSTDPKRLEKMYRIENIKNLLPKPVGKPAAADKDPKAEKKEEKKEGATQTENAAAPVPAAAAPSATAPAGEEKKKKKHKHKTAKAEG